MTNKEFFLKTIEAEAPIFVKVIEAAPKERGDWKPHEKARTLASLITQLTTQPAQIAAVASGRIDFTASSGDASQDIGTAGDKARKNFASIRGELGPVSDEDWESGLAVAVSKGGEWKTKKGDMAWGLLFDMIHHRGQLTTYLRAMGAKVPSVYGGSADEKPGA
jgi:uncharacterized damage-inducible protein DinB